MNVSTSTAKVSAPTMTTRVTRAAALTLAVVIVGGVSLVRAPLGVAAAPRAQDPTWDEARPGYTFVFPRDHAAHPGTASSGGTTPATSQIPPGDGLGIK